MTGSEGAIDWQRTYGGSGEDAARAVLVDPASGRLTIAARTDSFGAGARDFWILRTDERGRLDPACGLELVPTDSATPTNAIPGPPPSTERSSGAVATPRPFEDATTAGTRGDVCEGGCP